MIILKMTNKEQLKKRGKGCRENVFGGSAIALCGDIVNNNILLCNDCREKRGKD